MEKLKRKALKLGATNFGISTVQNKRFFVIYLGKKINFASILGSTFYDHKNRKKRKAWIARHSKITNKKGEYVIYLKTSPSYWANAILW